MSTPGNLTNGKTASLTLRDNDRSAYASLSPTRLVNTSRLWLTGHVDFFGEANLFEGFAEHAAASVACERHADGLGNERHGARCTRVHFDHVEFAVLHGELHVHEAADVEFLREFLGVLADLFLDLTPLASAAALGHRKMQAFFCDTRFARFSLERVIGGMTRMTLLLLGVPAHKCAVGLYFRGYRRRFARRHPPKTKPCYASLVPKGSLSLTRMLGKNATSGFQ